MSRLPLSKTLNNNNLQHRVLGGGSHPHLLPLGVPMASTAVALPASSPDGLNKPPASSGISKKDAAAMRFSALLLAFEMAMILIFAFTADYQHTVQANSVVGDGGCVGRIPRYPT